MRGEREREGGGGGGGEREISTEYPLPMPSVTANHITSSHRPNPHPISSPLTSRHVTSPHLLFPPFQLTRHEQDRQPNQNPARSRYAHCHSIRLQALPKKFPSQTRHQLQRRLRPQSTSASAFSVLFCSVLFCSVLFCSGCIVLSRVTAVYLSACSRMVFSPVSLGAEARLGWVGLE